MKKITKGKNDVLRALAHHIQSGGGNTFAAARQMGVNVNTLNHVLKGRRKPTEKILKALNFSVVITTEYIENG
jgi:hypothetical protein